ncbi:hypothetical protein BH11BAC5_BH11BAC5_32780 [soil metagenome]|jgi:hypothetical protein
MTTATANMTTKQIANRLKLLCSKGKFEQAQRELFADDAVSIEQQSSPMFEKETHGIEAIVEKGQKFESMVEKMYSNTLSDPLMVGNTIAMTAFMDVTMKGRPRETMGELCVYTVKDGKIVSEQFFM